MRDYEELAAKLRYCAGSHACGAACPGERCGVTSTGSRQAVVLRKAADAIEKLKKCVELEYQSGFADGQRAANRKKNKWISVEDALPELPKEDKP